MRKWIIFITENSLVLLLLAFVGFMISLFLVKDLNVEAFPDPSPPMVEIVTIYEGRSAEEVEKRITLPIEIGLASMRGMERLNSISLYGLSDISASFPTTSLTGRRGRRSSTASQIPRCRMAFSLTSSQALWER
jgi:cobalt-zinc-cadmium resistance protein CzcA